MTIEQTVEIPADHRVYLDFEVPPEIPVGATTRFEIRWFPQKEAVNNLDAALEEIWALCKDAPVTVDSFLEERRRDNEIKEERYRQFFSKSGDDN
jgi:MoaA/NifB/PqqE/SkfB family radical SAM enzyme